MPGAEGGKDPVSAEVARAAVARTHLIQWAYGVSVFCWYMFDEAPNQVCIRLSRSTAKTLKPDYAALTPAGETYNEVARWLIGARMVGKTVEQSPTKGQRWTIEVARDSGYRGWIVWDTAGSAEVMLPIEWGVRQVRSLDGTPPHSVGRRVTVGLLPLLLENPAGAARH